MSLSDEISAYSEEPVKKAIKDILEEIEDAQEDCGNLDWISKDQAIKIIKQRVGGKLLKNE